MRVLVEYPKQAVLRFSGGGFKEFEIANSRGIKDEVRRRFLATQGVDVFERGLLRLANVVNDGAGSSGCQALVCESESVESGGLQLVAQDTRRIVRIKQPVLHRGLWLCLRAVELRPSCARERELRAAKDGRLQGEGESSVAHQ